MTRENERMTELRVLVVAIDKKRDVAGGGSRLSMREGKRRS